MKFNWKYFLAFIGLFLIELMIALYVHDSFIRPFFGDVLVVILLFFLIKSFFIVDSKKLSIGIFIFACTVEFLQFIDIVKVLGFENNKIISVVVGRSFSWLDILCYLVGAIFLYFAAKWKKI